MAIKELVTNIVKDYVGEELTKEKAIELTARITQGLLMTREGAGLPEKPGRSTQFSPNEKEGPDKKEPNYPPGYTPPEERKPRTLAVVSHPHDDPTKPPDEQDGTAPYAIQSRE